MGADVATGGIYTCAVATNKKVKCFGHNLFGNLGYGEKNIRGHYPGEMSDNLPYVDLGTES